MPNPRAVKISIHALREEGDREIVVENSAEFVFLSTPSARRATVAENERQRTHNISIHALREEGD